MHEIWPKLAVVYIYIATDLRFKVTFRSDFIELNWRRRFVCYSNKSTNQMQHSVKFITWRYLLLNMCRASSCPSSGAQQLQKQPLVLPLECGGSSAVGRARAGRPDHDQQHCYYHVPTVKPEAATAVVELLVMGMRTPDTCWAVNNIK